jgi:hypothetical protein
VRRFFLAALAAAACNSPVTGTIQLTTGGETDTFTRAPAPVTLRIDSIDSSDAATTLASVPLPADTVDLGSLDQSTTGSLDVSGLDDGGKTIVHGTTVSLQYGALAGGTLPVFVQRVGELARLPDVVDARPAPLFSTVTGRFVLVVGGTDTSMNTASQIYDFAAFATLQSPPTMPRAPLSLAVSGTVVWLIDGIGNSANMDFGASTYDLSDDSTGSTMPPSAGGATLNYADVAGGATVTAPDGSQFVVGGTRTTGMPTQAVLVIDSMGNQYVATLSMPRLGASATWVNGRGLVVIGGSAKAAGVEVVGTGSGTGSPLAANGTPLAYPPDPTVGAGAAALDMNGDVLVAGGTTPAGKDAGIRAINVGCGTNCTAMPWGATLPAPLVLTYAQSFGIDAADALVVGSEASGTTHVFRVTTATATEVPLKIPRNNARAVLSPLEFGTVVVVGGGSNVMESYIAQ